MPERNVPSVKLRPGVYAPGREAVTQILEAALDLLISEGIRALTIRRIAAACDLSVGNVTYYFATKDLLLKAVLDVIAASYSEAIQGVKERRDLPPEERFADLIRFFLEDIRSETTTKLFPELWALSNHDPFVADCVNDIYKRGRQFVLELIRELNPGLNDEEREIVAVFVLATTEGMTLFAGYGKPFTDKIAWLEEIAVKGLVDLVRTVDSKTIRGLQAR